MSVEKFYNINSEKDFMDIFYLFIENKIPRQISLEGFTITYYKPSLLIQEDMITYFKDDIDVGFDTMDRKLMFNYDGEIVQQAPKYAVDTTYNVAMCDFTSMVDYLKDFYESDLYENR